MADDFDLDALTNEVAQRHSTSPEGIQSKIDRSIKNVPIYSISRKPVGVERNKRMEQPWYTRALQGGGLPGSMDEIKQMLPPNPLKDPLGFVAHLYKPFDPRNAWALAQHVGSRSGEQAGYAVDEFQQKNYGKAYGHGVAASVPILGPNIAEGNLAGAVGNIAAVAAPYAGKAIRTVVPEQFKFDLINRALGEGSIDPKFGKDLGRGLSRAKQGALTRGKIKQPSAGITKEAGIPAAVNAGLDEASLMKERLLEHAFAQEKTIPIKDLIEQNFGEGSLTQNPITNKPQVEAQTATNIPDVTGNSFSIFGTRLLNELMRRADPRTFKISPAEIEAMRKERVIDPNYGKFSTDAPEASLNQKAVRVSSDLVKAAEDAFRLPSGESALELLNSHISDLMVGKDIIPEKLAASRTAKASVLDKFNPKTIVKKAVAEAVEGRRDPGFNTGRFMMPIKTGLASWLTEKPWWLEDPTKGLKLPPSDPAIAFPDDLFNGSGGPGLPPHPPAGYLREGTPDALGSSQTRKLGAGVGQPGGGVTVDSGATGAVQFDFPPEPKHVVTGNRVSGYDAQGNVVSGTLEKLYATVEGGVPKWKAIVLDLKKGKTVELPADEVFDAIQGPPNNAKVTPNEPYDVSRKGKKGGKIPGSEPAGIAGGPPIGPDDPIPGLNRLSPESVKQVMEKLGIPENEARKILMEVSTAEAANKPAPRTRQGLKARGYTDADIDKMTFQEAADSLRDSGPLHQIGDSVSVQQENITPMRENNLGPNDVFFDSVHAELKNVLNMNPKLFEKKLGEIRGALEDKLSGAPDPRATSPEVIDAAKRLKFTLRADDLLGFDSVGEAMTAIREHADFAERWPGMNPDTIKAANAWRRLMERPTADVVPFKPKGQSSQTPRPPGTSGDGIFGDPKNTGNKPPRPTARFKKGDVVRDNRKNSLNSILTDPVWNSQWQEWVYKTTPSQRQRPYYTMESAFEKDLQPSTKVGRGIPTVADWWNGQLPTKILGDVLPEDTTLAEFEQFLKDFSNRDAKYGTLGADILETLSKNKGNKN